MAIPEDIKSQILMDPQVQKVITEQAKAKGTDAVKALQDPEVRLMICNVAQDKFSEYAPVIKEQISDFVNDPAVKAKAQEYLAAGWSALGQAGQVLVRTIQQGPEGLRLVCFAGATGEVTGSDGKRSAAAAFDPTQLTAGAPALKQQRWDVLEAWPGMTGMTGMTAMEALPGMTGVTSVETLPGMTAVEGLPGMAAGTIQAGAIPPPPPPASAAAVADLVSGTCPTFVPPRLMSGTSEQTTARLAGSVKSFNMAKGFGFIACQGISEDIFFLRSELPGGLATGHADQGQLVGFDLQFTPEGRYRAARISLE